MAGSPPANVTVVTGGDLLDCSVTAVIGLASVGTGSAMRDGHLRTAGCLGVGKCPAVDCRPAGVRRTGGGWIIAGDLTLHGVTRQVPPAVEGNGFGSGRWGGRRAWVLGGRGDRPVRLRSRRRCPAGRRRRRGGRQGADRP
ncbi:YceI family protein [Streptomyces sp. NPDC059010]|uniref:YceI family protein n=1 Tax=Streptomyces sp. NPDC059010 TaxID=3346695 RepID=UPI003692B4F2